MKLPWKRKLVALPMDVHAEVTINGETYILTNISQGAGHVSFEYLSAVEWNRRYTHWTERL